MANTTPEILQTEHGEVKIFAPDRALKEKIGNDMTFDQVVTPQVVEAAQNVIVQAAGDILTTVLIELEHVQAAAAKLAVGMDGDTALSPMIEAAFAIKSKAGLCGYPFASQLAKALHVFCELDAVKNQPITMKSLDIIRSQVAALSTVFSQKLTGDGGKVGMAILAELQKVSAGYSLNA